MKIYTKTGDKGTTQVYSKEVFRLSKADILLENYGNLDELNSSIGMLTALISQIKTLDEQPAIPKAVDMGWIQNTIFSIGFALSDEDKLSTDLAETLETWIDLITAELPAQTSFILPGGCVAASQAHICRTITRRTERTLVALSSERDINELALKFINRLSDFFFTLARYLNHVCKIEDIKVS